MVDEQACVSKDGPKLRLSPETLALVLLRFLIFIKDVVQQDDEGLRRFLSRRSESSRDQLGLRLAEEGDQVLLVKVTSDPDHEDAAVVERPDEVLHGALLSIAESRVTKE